MKSMALAALCVIGAAAPVSAQPARPIRVAVEARNEGVATADRAAVQLLADVRRGLQAAGGVELVAQKDSQRMVWIIVAAAPGVHAASVMVTERYTRETLMVLGIEDDDMAARMMALQIANDHQIFSATDPAELARRIVETLSHGVLSRTRAR